MQSTRVRPKILVVDDEPEVLRSIHDLLRINYQVVTRQSGGDGLEYLRANPDVAVVLTDQRMPGMLGVEVLQQAATICPQTTRLLFTAYADIHAVISAINQGHVFRYVTKPWEPEELESVIGQSVERFNLITEKARLVAELQASNARLEEANRLKNVFLEVASHELNTPVTVVLGLTELWKLSMSPQASPRERLWIERINIAASRLARTVQRMLKLIETGAFGQTLMREPVHLELLVREAVAALTPYLESRQQNVLIQVDPGSPTIQGDSSKLLDVLINLLANAIKFTPDEGTIHVGVQPVESKPGWVRVKVEDEGVGVQPSEQPYLFEPFFTGFDTLHHSSGEFEFGKKGIGLGLCLVKSFVELHGGRVEHQSTPGRGSSFGFTLPGHPPEPDAHAASRTADGHQAARADIAALSLIHQKDGDGSIAL